MASLVIGAPVRDREWIIRPYLNHAFDAALEAGFFPDEIAFVFVGDHASDDTFRVIESMVLGCGASLRIVHRDESPDPYVRNWGLERLKEMVDLRNILLHEVREIAPPLFWSLDSDILVHRQTLASAAQALGDGFDAVGSKCYMSRSSRKHPSYADLSASGNLLRPDHSGLISVDVIMAAKLMTPGAYAIDYEFDRRGEDIGWSNAARKSGCRLGWDGRVTSKHVLSKPDLDVEDPRCGY